jgi:hypothetical protein
MKAKYWVIQGENGMYQLWMEKPGGDPNVMVCESFSEYDLKVSARLLNEASKLPRLNWKGEVE